MKHILPIVLIATAASGFGAHFGSVRAGMWADPSTWNGGVPGNGDTVQVNHEVTVLSNVTVGHSPSVSKDTVAAINIRGGSLQVGPAATLVVRGDIRLESLNSTARAAFIMQAGSSLVQDSSAAATPNAVVYRIYAVGPRGNYPRIHLNGAAENPIRVSSLKANGASNHILSEPVGNSIDLRITHATIEDCGTLNHGCIKHAVSSGNGSDGVILQHVTMRRTSGIKNNFFAGVSPATGGDVFVLHDVKMLDTISDPSLPGYTYPHSKGSLYVNAFEPITTGRREITECYFDMGIAHPTMLTGFTILHSVFDRYPPTVNAANGVLAATKTWARAENIVYRALNVTARGIHGSVKGLYFYGDSRAGSRGNPHGITVGIKGDTTIDRMIFEYGDDPADPNGLVQQPYPSTGGPWNYTYTWKNSLMLPSSYYNAPTETSSIMINNGISAPPVRMVIEHNTFMISGNFAQTNYLNETGIAQEHSVSVFRSNLGWDVMPGRSYLFTVNPNKRPNSPPNALHPAGTDFNACFNCLLTSSSQWPDSTSNETVYDVPTTTVKPGIHDVVNVDPQFVDPTRNIKRWIESRAGLEPFTGTADQAMQYLASGPGSIKERIDDLHSWVPAGFEPRSPAFIGTAHDGGTIGAVQPRGRISDAPTIVRIESNVSAYFTVAGLGCPEGTYSTPSDIAWTEGVACRVSALSAQGTSESRFAFANWADGPVSSYRTITAAPRAVYGLVFAHEHKLLRTVSGQGAINGVDGFYPHGTTIQMSATAAAGYRFVGWSGSLSGTANPVTLTMDRPQLITAEFLEVDDDRQKPIMNVVGLTPALQQGSSGKISATFSHSEGVNSLYLGYILFLPTPNIVSYTARGSCLIEYNRISNGMRLIDDPGTGWLGPLSGVVVGPQAGTLSNSQCGINLSAASVVLSSSTMTVTVPVTFKDTMTPTVATFLQAADVNGNWTGMTQFGNWKPSVVKERTGPSITKITSSATAGSSALYSIISTHTSGASKLGMVNLLVSTAIVGDSSCHAVYFPGSKTINLVNDDGSGLVSSAGVPVGTPGVIANSRCALNTGLTSQTVVGQAVIIVFALTFQTSTFSGVKKVYGNTFDTAGQLTHWVQAPDFIIR